MRTEVTRLTAQLSAAESAQNNSSSSDASVRRNIEKMQAYKTLVKQATDQVQTMNEHITKLQATIQAHEAQHVADKATIATRDQTIRARDNANRDLQIINQRPRQQTSGVAKSPPPPQSTQQPASSAKRCPSAIPVPETPPQSPEEYNISQGRPEDDDESDLDAVGSWLADQAPLTSPPNLPPHLLRLSATQAREPVRSRPPSYARPMRVILCPSRRLCPRWPGSANSRLK